MDLDPYKFKKITKNPDDSITKLLVIPSIPPTGDQTSPTNPNQLCYSKYVSLNSTHNTFIRIYKPIQLDSKSKKVPIIIYFHGGGFVFYSVASPMFHKSCERSAAAIPSLILSVEYHLALEAIKWVSDQAKKCSVAGSGGGDPWLNLGR